MYDYDRGLMTPTRGLYFMTIEPVRGAEEVTGDSWQCWAMPPQRERVLGAHCTLCYIHVTQKNITRVQLPEAPYLTPFTTLGSLPHRTCICTCSAPLAVRAAATAGPSTTTAE